MTISNTKAKSVYETNGERREWEIGFDFDSNVSKLNIILEDREGYQTIVEDNYLIEDGVVIYPSLESELDPIAEGYKIILIRETANNQEIDFRDNLVEQGLDKLTLQVQEIAEEVDRAIKVPVSEEGLSNYKNPVLEIREETKKSLHEIKEATSVVSDYTQESALNAVTSKEEADRAVEASNVSVIASSDAEAFATKAENLVNEAHNAVSAYVNGLGAMRNAVLDLGVFEDTQRRASSSIIDFDFEPLDVFVRFSDSEKKMWIKGSHSFAGIEKVGDKKYKIFYSVSSEDFASQSAIKGPFYVQYVIKYSMFEGAPVIYKGRVDTFEELPSEAEDGDLWYVGPVEQENKKEYIWSDGKFELVGSTSREDYESLHNDLDELGDQVSVIESKIPADTSDTNPLVNKQQLLDEVLDIRTDMNETDSLLQTQITANATAIDSKQDKLTAGEGITIEGNVISATASSLPEGIYTQTNLLGGKDIEIVKKSGGIDENTIACWHFEGTINDEVNGTPANQNTATLATDYTKFGTGSVNGGVTYTSIAKDVNSPISFDFWALVPIPGISSFAQFFLYTSDPTYGKKWMDVVGAAGSKLTVALMGGATVTTDFTVPKNEWVHYYGHYIPETKTSEFFANGKKIFSQQNANYPGITKFELNKSGVSRFDEVRISKEIRWTEDFTPPTQPYRKAEPTGNYVINFTGEAGGNGKNIGEVYYSQSSLASDNAGALPLFTGETIASANTIYPDFYAWVEKHNELQTTAEAYETALTTYGECPKYVLSASSLRLPKLSLLNRRLVERKEATETDPTWYNLYSDGYLEQGGKIGRTTAGQTTTIELVKPFANTNYTVLASTKPDDSNSISGRIYTVSKNLTTTSFNVTNNGWSNEYNGITGFWEVKGYIGANTLENNFPWVFAYNATVPASTAQAAEFQEGLSGKVDLVAGVTNDKVDYVVDSYSDENGNWYRVYKSGWIEQGGHQTTVVGAQFAEQTVMLLKPMKTTTYHKNLIATFLEKGDNTIVVRLDDLNLYTDRIIVRKHWLSENGSFYWEVKGQGA